MTKFKPEMNECAITTWTKMRRLDLAFTSPDGDERDDVNDILPMNMENMNKLESLRLSNYQKVTLPDCISQFQSLRTLDLTGCRQLRALPACEIAGGGFPMLKELRFYYLDKLESMVASSVESSKETMAKLQDINISYCGSLKRLGTKKLRSLKKLELKRVT